MFAKTTRTSHCPRWVRTTHPILTTTSKGTSRNGFTLIEVLIVVAIITMVLSVGLPAIQQVTYQRINSTTRKFIGLIRTIRNDAVLLQNIYRLAIDFEHKTYWVEAQKEFKPISELAEVVAKPKKKGEKKEEPVSNFAFAPKYSKQPIEMPSGVIFAGVLKEMDGLKKEGVAYIHFFPNGFTEQSILYLTREGDTGVAYSLVIRPTSGRIELHRERVDTFD